VRRLCAACRAVPCVGGCASVRRCDPVVGRSVGCVVKLGQLTVVCIQVPDVAQRSRVRLGTGYSLVVTEPGAALVRRACEFATLQCAATVFLVGLCDWRKPLTEFMVAVLVAGACALAGSDSGRVVARCWSVVSATGQWRRDMHHGATAVRPRSELNASSSPVLPQECAQAWLVYESRSIRWRSYLLFGRVQCQTNHTPLYQVSTGCV
jgi:hypothetical protein